MLHRRLAALSRHLNPNVQIEATTMSRRLFASAVNAVSLPDHMQAVVLPKPGPASSMVLKSIPVPRPEPGQVLVKVAATAVCHRDVLDRKGAFPFMQEPTVLGHEIAGTVAAVGDGLCQHDVGQQVVSLHFAGCRQCGPCSEARSNDCATPVDFLALTANGGYAEYVCASSDVFVPVPEGWTAAEAAPMVCTFGTVWHAALTRGGLKPGERLLVTGASGGVGSAAVQLASRLGCEVLGVTSSPDKVDYIMGLGASAVVVNTDGRFHTDPALQGGVDMAFEAVGGPTFEGSLRSLRRGGRLVLIGNVTAAKVPLKLGLAIINSLSIIGSDSVTAAEMRHLFAFMDTTGLRPTIERVLPLADAAAAHTLLEDRAVNGRIVLDVNAEAW